MRVAVFAGLLGLAAACDREMQTPIERPLYRAEGSAVGEDACHAIGPLGASIAERHEREDAFRPGFYLDHGLVRYLCLTEGPEVACRPAAIETMEGVLLNSFPSVQWSGDDLVMALEVRGTCVGYGGCEDLVDAPTLPCESRLELELVRLFPQPPGEPPERDESCDTLAGAPDLPPGEGVYVTAFNYSGTPVSLKINAIGLETAIAGASDLGVPGRHIANSQTVPIGALAEVFDAQWGCVRRFYVDGPVVVIGGGRR